MDNGPISTSFNSIFEVGTLNTLEICGAKVLGKISVPGRPTNLDNSRSWSIALAVGADGGCVVIFFLSRLPLLFFIPLSGRRPDIE